MQYLKRLILALICLLFIFIQVNAQKKQKCFENDGLKYKTVVTINFLSASPITGMVAGTVTSREYDAETTAKTDFTGTISNHTLKIKFKGTSPATGNATEWTNKPWILKKNKGVENLYIIFHSKNYDTKKWSNTTAEFTTCQ